MSEFLRWHQRLLISKRRSAQSNRFLGQLLAFIAGAINAGGFMVVHQYTSHMTGILSLAVDSIALSEWWSALAMLCYILSFIAGAATTAILVIWGRTRYIYSQYAVPLALEAVLLLIFGLLHSASIVYAEQGVPYIIALLCYVMGLQNAVITKISSTTVRTTHITGMVTDIGIELGRMYMARKMDDIQKISLSREKITLHLSIVLMFLAGGIVGAYGFKYIGFLSVIPLASYLLFIAFFPIKRDMVIRKYIQRKLRRAR